MVVCLLHQGFNAYAEQLAHATQREWEKIAGRFEEILFQQPLDQVALLVDCAPVFFRSVSDGRPHQSPIRVQGFGSCPMRAAIFRLFKTFKPLEF
jgi:hypothetical protein